MLLSGESANGVQIKKIGAADHIKKQGVVDGTVVLNPTLSAIFRAFDQPIYGWEDTCNYCNETVRKNPYSFGKFHGISELITCSEIAINRQKSN